MKNVLLLVHDDAGEESRFQAALDLTRALGGHLTCVDVSVPPLPVGDYYDGPAQAMLIEMEYAREAANKAKLEARLAQNDVPWCWIDVTETIADAVLDAARLADLIVVNRKLESSPHPDMRDIASRIVMHARKPVIAVPETLKRLELGRALIAWDGQESCAATMRACVPMLALANEVEIFMVRDGAEKTEPTEAAEYLSRHGIHSGVRIVEDGVTPPDLLITQEGTHWQADYVMMGAYNHGRLVEAFGGVTKRLLTNSALPLVLGH